MATKNKILVIVLLLLIGCKDQDVKPANKVSWTVEAPVSNDTFILALVDDNDKFEQVVYFKSGKATGVAKLNEGDLFELRTWCYNEDVRSKTFHVVLVHRDSVVIRTTQWQESLIEYLIK